MVKFHVKKEKNHIEIKRCYFCTIPLVSYPLTIATMVISSSMGWTFLGHLLRSSSHLLPSAQVHLIQGHESRFVFRFKNRREWLCLLTEHISYCSTKITFTKAPPFTKQWCMHTISAPIFYLLTSCSRDKIILHVLSCSSECFMGK